MAINWCHGKVVDKTVWTNGLFTLHVRVAGVQPFEPGQFIQIGLLTDEGMINRPYSIASPFGEVLEFYIVKVDDGKLTPRLEKLDVGDDLEVADRATGSFTLKKTPASKYLWLIATGTGLAPYIAMLRTPEPWGNYEKIVVVHGVRVDQDLSYQDEFAKYSNEFGDRFCYIPTLTRESVSGKLNGRIPGLISTGEIEEFAGINLCAGFSVVMLCGNPAMLDDVELILGERGMKKHRSKAPGHIVLERYW